MKNESARRLLENTPQSVKDKVRRVAEKIIFKNKLLSLPCKNSRLRVRLIKEFKKTLTKDLRA